MAQESLVITNSQVPAMLAEAFGDGENPRRGPMRPEQIKNLLTGQQATLLAENMLHEENRRVPFPPSGVWKGKGELTINRGRGNSADISLVGVRGLQQRGFVCRTTQNATGKELYPCIPRCTQLPAYRVRVEQCAKACPANTVPAWKLALTLGVDSILWQGRGPDGRENGFRKRQRQSKGGRRLEERYSTEWHGMASVMVS